MRQKSDQTGVHLSLSSAWLQRVVQTAFEPVPQVQLRDQLLAQRSKTLLVPAKAFPHSITTLYQESLATTLVLHLTTLRTDGQNAEGPWVPLPGSASDDLELYRRSPFRNDLANRFGQAFRTQRVAIFAPLSGHHRPDAPPIRYVDACGAGSRPPRFRSARPRRGRRADRVADQSHLTRHIYRTLGVTLSELIKS